MMPAMIAALVLAACTGTTSITVAGDDDTAAPDGDSGTSELPGDTDTSEAEDTAPDEDPEANRAWQDAFFVDTVIHDISLELDEDQYRELRRDPHSYALANATVDGEPLEDVGVRLRGKIGSFRDLSGKPKFKIDINQTHSDQRLHGLKTLVLNNSVVDCSYLKEPLAYQVYRDLGLAASRTSFARVELNGDPYGLYVIIEAPDSELLEVTHPDDDEGNLYDGKYLYDWNTGGYTLLDFAAGVDDLYALEEGEDIDNADIAAVSQALDDAPRGPGYVEAMDPVLDWAQWHAAWAAEQWVGHLDGYQMNRNNYRVYFPPSDGKMEYLPTDFDYGFLSDGGWGVWWTSPLGNLASRCMLDVACRSTQVDAVESMLGRLDVAALVAKLDAMRELIREDAYDDPRRECGTGDIAWIQDYLESWTTGREAVIRSTWGI